MSPLRRKLLVVVVIWYLMRILKTMKSQKKRPAMRVNPYLRDRSQKGRFATDFQDMKLYRSQFYENFHMNSDTFHYVLEMLEPHLIPRRNTRPYDKITPMEKLSVVFEYFASGSIQRHMASVYRISKQHLGTIIDQVCDAIFHSFHHLIPKVDKTKFLEIANEFHLRWNFPNCLGAIDGKHVAVRTPNMSGSLFYNYKGFHSLFLMAISDASYKFSFVDIGALGSEGDAGAFAASDFGKEILSDSCDFPEDSLLYNKETPYFFIGDDAFPLGKRILKPYGGKKLSKEERIFNYRLSRARRCVENSFGILYMKWLCLKRTMFCSPARAQKIILACCLLHNLLIIRNRSSYSPRNFADHSDANGNIVEGDWRHRLSGNEDSLFENFISSPRGRPSNIGKNTREHIKDFVNSPAGAVPRQEEAAFVQ